MKYINKKYSIFIDFITKMNNVYIIFAVCFLKLIIHTLERRNVATK